MRLLRTQARWELHEQKLFDDPRTVVFHWTHKQSDAARVSIRIPKPQKDNMVNVKTEHKNGAVAVSAAKKKRVKKGGSRPPKFDHLVQRYPLIRYLRHRVNGSLPKVEGLDPNYRISKQAKEWFAGYADSKILEFVKLSSVIAQSGSRTVVRPKDVAAAVWNMEGNVDPESKVSDQITDRLRSMAERFNEENPRRAIKHNALVDWFPKKKNPRAKKTAITVKPEPF